MKLNKYILDKLSWVIIFILCYLIILMMLIAFKTPKELIIAITLVLIIMAFICLLLDFFKKKKFYDELINNINKLDKKFLVLETINIPNFYEGKILYQSLYEINKSMIENVNKYIEDINNYKDYIEMWIHEVKIPISSLVLLCHNNKIDKTYIKQIKKLDNYIDQVLYYVRSNYLEQDFIFKKVKLEKVITNVALKNKDDLLENKIDLDVDLNNLSVYTDYKWLEFILNQIVNNSIKYKRNINNSIIKISAEENRDKIILSIYDNGKGISKNDLKNVFKKSFTGENGRFSTKSTGMGLYIAYKLCNKLGHIIKIESSNGNYTIVKIIFGKNKFYKLED